MTPPMTPPARAPACAPAGRGPPRRALRASSGTPRNEGHGKRLTAAFEALERFPALAESRNRLLPLDRRGAPVDRRRRHRDRVRRRARDRRAAARQRPRAARAAARSRSIVAAVEVLSPEAVQALAAERRDLRVLRARQDVGRRARSASGCTPSPSSAPPTASPPQAGYPHRDRLLVTALLHDIGKLVLMHAYPGYPKQVHGPARTPEERLHYERRELGVDHALVGGVLARRWNLPPSVASAIERHHADDAQGDAAFVRLADMLAHYSQGSPVSSNELLRAARAVGFGPSELRTVLYDLPYPSTAAPARGRAVPAVRRASSRSSSASPRAWSTSRSRTSCRSRRARCARTCTTSTASSAPSTARRRCFTPPSAAGCRPPRRSPRPAAEARRALGLRGHRGSGRISTCGLIVRRAVSPSRSIAQLAATRPSTVTVGSPLSVSFSGRSSGGMMRSRWT